MDDNALPLDAIVLSTTVSFQPLLNLSLTLRVDLDCAMKNWTCLLLEKSLSQNCTLTLRSRLPSVWCLLSVLNKSLTYKDPIFVFPFYLSYSLKLRIGDRGNPQLGNWHKVTLTSMKTLAQRASFFFFYVLPDLSWLILVINKATQHWPQKEMGRNGQRQNCPFLILL